MCMAGLSKGQQRRRVATLLSVQPVAAGEGKTQPEHMFAFRTDSGSLAFIGTSKLPELAAALSAEVVKEHPDAAGEARHTRCAAPRCAGIR